MKPSRSVLLGFVLLSAIQPPEVPVALGLVGGQPVPLFTGMVDKEQFRQVTDIDLPAWERASQGRPREHAHAEYGRGSANTPAVSEGPDPYATLGLAPGASNEAARAAWRGLIRENHPDALAARGMPAELVRRASSRMAEINAAWDRIKRERGL